MIVGDSCWVLVGDEMRMFGDGSWLFVFGVEGLHMLCERSARVVRMVSTSGVEGQLHCCRL